MTTQQVRQTTLDKPDFVEVFLRMAGGGLTVGLLIVLPALKILGLF